VAFLRNKVDNKKNDLKRVEEEVDEKKIT